MTCRDAARVSDLEQPLLDGGSKSDRVPGSAAQNGHARSEASEAAEFRAGSCGARPGSA